MKIFDASIFVLFMALLSPFNALAGKARAAAEVLIYDAVTVAVRMGATIGAIEAAKEFHPSYDPLAREPLNDDTRYVKKVGDSASFSSGQSIGDCLGWVNREISFGYLGGTSGLDVARAAAYRAGQSESPDIWGPDLIVSESKAAAKEAILNGRHEEEVGMAAAQAAWDWMTEAHTDEMEDAVRKALKPWHVKDDYAPVELVADLRLHLGKDSFQLLLPEAQAYYIKSVEQIASILGQL